MPDATDRARFARLPKWARDTIEQQERRIEELKIAVQTAKGDRPYDRVVVNPYDQLTAYPAVNFPKRSTVGFDLGVAPREPNDTMQDYLLVDLRKAYKREHYLLSVRSCGPTGIIVVPQASNNVHILLNPIQ